MVTIAVALLALPGQVASQPTFAETLPTEEEVATRLFGVMERGAEGMERAWAAYDAGEHEEALDAWRDVKVRQIRATHLGRFLWHSSHEGSKRGDWLAGIDVGGYGEVDRWGDRGAPGTRPPVDWLSSHVEERIDNKGTGYGWYLRYIPLAGRFHTTGEPVYLQKWFEVTADFALNQKRLVLAAQLPPEQLRYYDCCWDYRDFASSLFQAHRVLNILKTLGVFSRSLTPEDRQVPWDDIGDAAALPLADDDLSQVPSLELALVAMSLMQDHPEALIGRCVEGSAIPNQRKEGLTALLMLSLCFPEFASASELGETVEPAWDGFTRYWFLPDGADMEQSFNYNANDINTTHDLVRLFGQKPLPAWLTRARTGADMYRRMRAALLLPIGGAPQVGNGHLPDVPELWRDDETARQWLAEMLEGRGGIPEPLDETQEDPLVSTAVSRLFGGNQSEPAFTSVTFPYMGYTMMRDGWETDSLALFFMGSHRTSGHINADVNGIQVVAYGRPLLVYSGSPTYGTQSYLKTAPPEFDVYSQEGSSWKVNTVLVDGWSQMRQNALPPTQLKPNPWHTSAHFDYVSREYEGGYRKLLPRGDGTEADFTVTHERQVSFVRGAGLWVVVDTLTNASDAERQYTQVWNFPPRVEEDRRPVFGFAEDEVQADADSRRVFTSDTDGPNVHLYHFGPPVLYGKHFGGREPAPIEPVDKGVNPVFGWYARWIADAVPAVDVHATWTGGPGASTLVTVIAPSRGPASPIASIAGVGGGFDASLTDGQRLSFRIADEPADLQALGARLAARRLLVHEADGQVRGIVLGASELGGDVEFEVREGRAEPVARITVPEGFRWVETDDGVVPDYGAE